jgi:hypothetical protein
MKMKNTLVGALAVCLITTTGLMAQSQGRAGASAEEILLNRMTQLDLHVQRLVNSKLSLAGRALEYGYAYLELELLELQLNLLDFGFPVKPLVGDDIGIRNRVTMGPGGSGWLKEPNGITVGPGGNGWLKDPNGITMGPRGTGWLKDPNGKGVSTAEANIAND